LIVINGLGGKKNNSMMNNFNDFYWHDAEIKEIIIDRHNPGNKDEIQFNILFPDKRKVIHFIFEEVYYASFDLNFGIIANETILQALILDNDMDLIKLYAGWKGHLNTIKLNAYFLELNSTGGKIKIIAKGFRIEK
jgi:hypothetical protein